MFHKLLFMSNLNRSLPGIICGILFFVGLNAASAQTLQDIARDKIASLQDLISQAEKQGIDTYKEKLTIRTAEIFLEFADWDEANVEANTEYFKLVAAYRDTAAQAAVYLPQFERSEVIKILDEAAATLTDLLQGKIHRKPTPVIDWAQVIHVGDELRLNNRPVFLADYTWKPHVDKLIEFHGNQDGVYFDQNKVINETGAINFKLLNTVKNKPEGTIGFIFLGNKKAPDWAEEKYGPGFKMRENTFTGYDIDNPGALELNGMLFRGTIPYMAGKKYTQLGYMLCNEPHFYTTKTGSKLDWASGPVSEYTMQKFRNWLKNKHQDIQNLNTLWGTNFNSFDGVTLEIPIDNAIQGTPQWYDWLTFNCFRVTRYYSNLKDSIRKYDPQAKVHLKIMPNLWSDGKRGHGIDMEALTELSDIIGNDSGSEVAPMWGGPYEWQQHYYYDWRELFMANDFYKSVSPDKIMYNTEAHYLSTTRSRSLHLDPKYARAAFWAAVTTGMTATQIWFWPRNADGSMTRSGEKGYAGSNNQQPRVTNEVATTFADLNTFSEEIMALQRQPKPIRIFYSETTATNKLSYMDEIFSLYESLNFEGVSLGFVTKNILTKQDDSKWDVVLIKATETVTADELAAVQAYLNRGGTVIIDAVSLKKDEYKRPLPGLSAGKGQLLVLDDEAAMKAKALDLVEAYGHMPPVEITETNSQGVKTCTWKWALNDKGNPILSVINLGKAASSLKIRLKNAKTGTTCTDLIKGIVVSSEPVLEPNEVFFVEVTDDNKLPTGAHNLHRREQGNIRLYPNPTSDYFTIDTGMRLQNVSLSVFSAGGQRLWVKEYRNVSSIRNSLAGYPNGVYFLNLKTEQSEQRLLLVKKG